MGTAGIRGAWSIIKEYVDNVADLPWRIIGIPFALPVVIIISIGVLLGYDRYNENLGFLAIMIGLVWLVIVSFFCVFAFSLLGCQTQGGAAP